jgi:hypothetical protein
MSKVKYRKENIQKGQNAQNTLPKTKMTQIFDKKVP